jgi:hypothetical protein
VYIYELEESLKKKCIHYEYARTLWECSETCFVSLISGRVNASPSSCHRRALTVNMKKICKGMNYNMIKAHNRAGK